MNVQEVMKDFDAAKSMEELLKLEQDEMSKILDSLMIPFQVKGQEFYKDAEKMSVDKRQTVEQELQQENQMIQSIQKQFQLQLQPREIA